jgi:hypothetical protein
MIRPKPDLKYKKCHKLMQCNGNVKCIKLVSDKNATLPLPPMDLLALGAITFFLYIKIAHTLKLQMVNSVFLECLNFEIQTIASLCVHGGHQANLNKCLQYMVGSVAFQ